MLEKETGKVVVLAAEVSPDSALDPGTPISYAEDISIAKDGTIYFTDGGHIGPKPPSYDIFRPVVLTILEVSCQDSFPAAS
jgi:hypothetical protein